MKLLDKMITKYGMYDKRVILLVKVLEIFG
jgi:hypothetical protein